MAKPSLAECAVISPHTPGDFCVLQAGHGGKHRDSTQERWSRRPDDDKNTVGAAKAMVAEAKRQAEIADEAAQAAAQADFWRRTWPEDAPTVEEIDAAGAQVPPLREVDRPPPPEPPPRVPDAHKPNGIYWDWDLIKRRYVEGIADKKNHRTEWPSLDAVAAYYGIPSRTVRAYCAREGWVEQRARYQAQVERTRQQARAQALARSAVQLDERALDAAKMGLQLCITKLAEIGQDAQRRRAGSVGTGVVSGIDAQEQQRLAYAVDLWHRIGLRAVGDPEVHRVEVTGPNGRPVSIAQELQRDDPSRITGVLSVLAQAGLGDLFTTAGTEPARAAVGDGGGDGGSGTLEDGA